ncbi:MAG: LemA family protein [Tidjanibacter sp.]|nr:LemA family protein [Tidjanibacter sp.]
MKKRNLWIALAVVAVVVVWGVSVYNGLVERNEKVVEKWSQVENQYQRRYDLVPNLVNTVKGYAEHEKGLLEGVVEARSKATSMTLDMESMTAEQLSEYLKVQNELGSAIKTSIVAIGEAYPDLKASNNFVELQAQLEGCENRIAVVRKDFNEAVRGYNLKVKRFPSNILAGLFGFDQKAYFESNEAAAEAPVVAF